MAIRWNEARYRQMLQSPAGPVGRFLTRSGIQIESRAKVLATTEGLVRTGRYRASIFYRLSQSPGVISLDIGSGVGYGRYLEHGTQPHRILPSTKRALWWTHGAERGWLVPERPLSGVNHPGNRAYQILGRSIVAVFGGRIRAAGS